MRTKLILIKIIFLSPICFSHLFYPLQSADCLEWLHYFNKVQVGLAATATSSLVSSSAPAFEPFLYLWGTAYLYIDLVYCFISGLGYCKVDKDLSKGWHLGSFLTSYLQILSLKSMPYLLCCIDNPLDIAKVWFLIFLFDVEIMMWVLFCEW